MHARPSTKKVNLGILGSTGRMGKALVAAARKNPLFHPIEDGGRSGFTTQKYIDVCKLSDVVIDVSLPETLSAHLAAVTVAKKPFLIGSTGHLEEARKAFIDASAHIPILIAPNFSLGVALCLKLVKQIASLFPCSIDIVETHHLEKKDRPSGTAMALAKACGRTAPIKSLREKDALGEHLVLFSTAEERILLKHQTLSRAAFAEGALKAALFLLHQPCGLYEMKDVMSVDGHSFTF